MKKITVREFLQKFENPFRTVIVNESNTILEVLKKMLTEKEERVVYVVDAKNTLQGIITTGKLAQHFFHEEISPSCGFHPSSSILHYLTAEHAKDIMERDVVYCTEDETLEEARRKMFGKTVKKTIPVVDSEMHIIDALNIITIMEYGLNGHDIP
ncbi:MAG: CBS domain-containing protein [Campylobacterota bacterium]|nr:CBS domain-containing protein [Campylobacterota bacterium]